MKLPRDSSQLPPLLESEIWYYPAYKDRPYSVEFGTLLRKLQQTEETFFRYLRYIQEHRAQADIFFHFPEHGKYSLDDWKFEIDRRYYEFQLTPQELVVQIDQGSRLFKDYREEDYSSLTGNYASRNSELGKLVQFLLPYMTEIIIMTVEDEITLEVQ